MKRIKIIIIIAKRIFFFHFPWGRRTFAPPPCAGAHGLHITTDTSDLDYLNTE